MEEEFATDDNIIIKNLVFKYLQYWKLFVLGAVIALFSMTLYLRYTQNIYSIESKIKILDDSKGMNLPSDALGFLSKSKVNLENEMEVITSKRLLEPVVTDLNLNTKYYHEGKFVNNELWNIPIIIKTVENKKNRSIAFTIHITPKGYKIDTAEQSFNLNIKEATVDIDNIKIKILPNPYYEGISTEKEFYVTISSTTNSVNSLANKIKVQVVGEDSDILAISIQDENIEKSKAVINKVIEKFNEDGINDRQLVSKRTVEFIHDRFKYLGQELDSIENKKKLFKQTNNLSFIEADAALDIQKKANSESALFQVETQLALSNLLKKAIIDGKSINTILPANLGLENQIINTLIAEFNTLVIERDKLNKTAGSQNPSLTGIDSRLAIVKSNIKQSIATYSKQLNINLSQQQKDFTLSKNNIAKIPVDEQYLRGIERQQQIKENLYLLLLQKREESAIAYAVTSPSIKIIDFANGSTSPISPNKNKLYLIALFAGLLIPFIILYLYFLFDTKIKSINERGFQVSAIPIVGEIPLFEDNDLFKNKDDRSIQAETFRILTSNINFSLPIKESKLASVLLVTSSVMGEGKTYITSNLALALASYNKKVLVIGADMRKPKLKESFHMEHSEKGLSSYLHQKETNWKELLVTADPYNNDLHILFTGSIPPNPSNLLSNGRFETLIEEAKKEYDYIIIDSTPTIYVNDTFLIANLVDLTIYVTRFNYTDKQLLEYSRGLATSNKLKNMVYILNGIQNKSNFNYRYNYNYGYGYGYNEENNYKKRSWLKKWWS